MNNSIGCLTPFARRFQGNDSDGDLMISSEAIQSAESRQSGNFLIESAQHSFDT